MLGIREELVDFSPYSPGLSIDEIKAKYNLASVIKMASNENPLGASPRVVEVIKKFGPYAFRYPRKGNPELVEKLSDILNIPDEYIVVTNGSDEIIDLIIRVLAVPYRDNIVVFDPSFSIYRMQGKFHGISVKYVPLNKDFSFNFNGILDAVDENTKIIFITNPDNPSGYCLPSQEIIKFLHKIPENVLLVVDEAYVEFSDDPEYYSCVREVVNQKNLGVIRTFSKLYGLAGLRIGYGILPLKLSDYIKRVKLPFSVNFLAEKAAIEVLEDFAFVEHTRNTVIEGRRYLKEEMEKLDCLIYPSQANFLMFKPPTHATIVFEGLLKRGIIIRPLNSYGLDDHLRVSVGREDENRLFIHYLKQILESC